MLEIVAISLIPLAAWQRDTNTCPPLLYLTSLEHYLPRPSGLFLNIFNLLFFYFKILSYYFNNYFIKIINYYYFFLKYKEINNIKLSLFKSLLFKYYN